MKSVFEISDILQSPKKRRRLDLKQSSPVIMISAMNTPIEEGEKEPPCRKSSMSPESCSEGEEGKAKVFSCNMCSYRTDRKNNLKRHTLTMHEMSQALLECCNMRFLNKAELRMHTQKYHADGYYCEVCDRNFCRKALLKRHFSVHSGYKEFSCRFCGYETSHKSNLERHMRVHRKTSPPTSMPQHLNHGDFLPRLPVTSSHLAPPVAFRGNLVTSQSYPILPSAHSHPTVFPLVGEHHPQLHPPLGTSWPVIHHQQSAIGRQTGLPSSPDSPSDSLNLHPWSIKSLLTSSSQEDPSSTTLTPKKKKGRPRRDFSVSALLAEDSQIEEEEEKDERKADATPLTISNLQKEPKTETSLPKVPSDTSPAHAHTRIQRPTPIHAYTRTFPYTNVMPFTSSYLSGTIQASTNAISSQTIQRNRMDGFPPSPRAFTSFHTPLTTSKERHDHEEPDSTVPDIRPFPEGSSCNQVLELASHLVKPTGRMEVISNGQKSLVDTPLSRHNIGILNSSPSTQSSHLNINTVHPVLSRPYPVHASTLAPLRCQTPKTGVQDSVASSGYESPGEGRKESQIQENEGFQNQVQRMEEEEEEDVDVDVVHSPEPMETGREEYIPKKLRASKKFQSSQ